MTQDNETAKTLTLGDLLLMATTGFGEHSHQANMVRMKIAEAPQGFDYQTNLTVYQAALLLTNSANQVPAQHVTVSRDLVRRAMIVLEQGGLNHGNVYSEFKEALAPDEMNRALAHKAELDRTHQWNTVFIQLDRVREMLERVPGQGKAVLDSVLEKLRTLRGNDSNR